MAMTSCEFKLDRDVTRLDVVVAERTGLSRAIVRGMFDHSCVFVNNAECDEAGRAVLAGATVRLRYDLQTRYKEKTRPRPHAGFRVAFEDKYLIVVEKVAGLLTVPTDHGEQNTLVHQIARYWSGGDRITQRAHIVHRLDRDTSGLLVFARTGEIAAELKDQFAAHKPEREYIAILAGTLPDDRGTFRSFLTTDDDLDQHSTVKPGEGKLAITHYEVRQRLRGATCVRVKLETGRRNQIRVHFSEIGHPVLGDVRYRTDLARHPRWPAARLALHALTLAFVHPVTQKPVRTTSEIPQEFKRFMAEMGIGPRS